MTIYSTRRVHGIRHKRRFTIIILYSEEKGDPKLDIFFYSYDTQNPRQLTKWKMLSHVVN